MKISQEGIELIKKFEGCKLETYRCSANVPTIGYGHTRTVEENMSITQDTAEALLVEDLKEFEGYVNDLVTVDLNENQFSSLVSWTFNLGPSNLKSSTLLKLLNQEKYDEIPAQIKRWNKSAGVVSDGLIRRREAESLLWQGKEWHDV
jgi:lysozyme|tara:strand:+ start:217 stop:660 length:444 start_codon:yes stop_codon:yes gene_type:complete